MKAYRVKWYTEELVRSNPHLLFIYGDNVLRKGKGGQAVIRDQFNTFGIVTKHKPTREEEAYFSDREEEFLLVDQDFRKLRDVILDGLFTGIVLPTDGIGTGLAELPRRSPKVYEYIVTHMYNLVKEVTKSYV